MNRQRLWSATIFSLYSLLLPSTVWSADEPVTSISLSEVTRSVCLQILQETVQQANETPDNKFWPAMHAAEALTLAGHAEDVRKALTRLLKTEKNDQHRCGLARELVRAGDRSQVAVMLNILTRENSNGHVHACESLYKVNEIGDGIAMRQAMQQTAN